MNQHLKALHIRFLPDQTQEDNLSSREFLKKADFVNIKTLLSGKDEDEDENGGQSQGGTTGGTTGGGTTGDNTGGGTTGGGDNSGGDNGGGLDMG